MNDGVSAVCQALAEMLGAYEPAVEQHLAAVAMLAKRLAIALRLDQAAVVRAELAGRLHDLGMVGIDRAILTKAGPLDAAELAAIRRHPLIGATLLERIPALASLSPVVMAHHERIDGTGYPRRLSGEQIPLESRIIFVVTAFHTMTVPQPYRSARSVQAALDELSAHAGTQFDERVVTAFVTLFARSHGK